MTTTTTTMTTPHFIIDSDTLRMVLDTEEMEALSRSDLRSICEAIEDRISALIPSCHVDIDLDTTGAHDDSGDYPSEWSRALELCESVDAIRAVVGL